MKAARKVESYFSDAGRYSDHSVAETAPRGVCAVPELEIMRIALRRPVMATRFGNWRFVNARQQRGMAKSGFLDVCFAVTLATEVALADVSYWS